MNKRYWCQKMIGDCHEMITCYPYCSKWNTAYCKYTKTFYMGSPDI